MQQVNFIVLAPLTFLCLCFSSCDGDNVSTMSSTSACPMPQLCLTLEQFVARANSYLNSSVSLSLSVTGNYTLESGLVIQDVKKVIMFANITKVQVTCNKSVNINFTNVNDVEIRDLTFMSCQVNSVKNITVTVQDCTFLGETASQNHVTMLNLKGSSATIKGSTFVSNGSGFYHHNMSVIVSYNSSISINASTFTVVQGGVSLTERSTVNIADSKFCNSNAVVPQSNHQALMKLSNTTLKVSNSIISNNTRRIIMLAKDSNISIGNTKISDNTGKFSVICFVKVIANITGGNTFSNNNGSLLVMNSYVEFHRTNSFKSCMLKYNKRRHHLQAEGTITSIQSTLAIHGTTSFLENHSEQSGAAIHALGSKISVHGNLMITNNTAGNGGGGAYLYLTELTCHGSCTFSGNRARSTGGGIHAVSTEIILRSETMWCKSKCKCSVLTIAENNATNGGGLYFEVNSRISGLDGGEYHYRVLFDGNTAIKDGGAIYVEDKSYSGTCLSKSPTSYKTNTECFLQMYNTDHIRGRQLHPHVNFTNNLAGRGRGHSLYGGLLDRCTVNPVADIYRSAGHNYSLVDGLTYFKSESGMMPEEPDQIASGPVRVCFCPDNVTHNCSYEPILHAEKGRNFTIMIVAVDQVDNTIDSEATVHASLSPENNLAEGLEMQKVSNVCSEITLSISSLNNSVDLDLYVRKGPCKDSGLSKRSVKVYFDECTCSHGFLPSLKGEKCTCDLHPKIKPYVTMYGSESLKIMGNCWIDYDNSGYIVHPNCPYDYCLPANKAVVNLNIPNGADAQCNFNRSGLLCGTCKPGFSLSTGTSRCLQCPKNWQGLLVLSLLVEVLWGILLVAIILTLNMTVATGTINGLTFYANIVQTHSRTFLPFVRLNFFTVFIKLLNTKVSSDGCYYKGMDAYARAWIKLLFPLYLIMLVGIIIVVSKYSSRYSTLIGKKNPVAALATLILLCYTYISRSITDIFMGAIVEYPSGLRQIVWCPDATVKFLQGKHIPLFLTAIVIVIVCLAYTLVLFSWQWLLQAPNVRIFKWIRNTKLNSFMEAYHAPYRPKYRYWTGLLLFARIIIDFQLEINVSGNGRYSLLTVGVVISSLLFLKANLSNRIYKRKLLDYIESVSYINLLLFTLASFYSLDNPPSQRISAYVSTSVALTTFLCILFYHTHCFLSNCLWYKRLSIWIKHEVNTKFRMKKVTYCTDNFENATGIPTPTSTEIGLSTTLTESMKENAKHRSAEKNSNAPQNKRQFQLGIKSYNSLHLRESLL